MQSAQCSAASPGLSPVSQSSVSAPQQVGPVRHAHSTVHSPKTQASSLSMSRALSNGTWSLACTGARPMTSAAPLSVVYGLFSYTFLASHSNCTMARSPTPAVSRSGSDHLRVGLPEPSVQRVAPVCGLRCESHLSLFASTLTATCSHAITHLRPTKNRVGLCCHPSLCLSVETRPILLEDHL